MNTNKTINCQVIRGGENSLNLIRLLAAMQVMYGHTLKHLHLEAIPLLHEFINFFHGVPIFFTLSGFLIWGSIGRSSSFRQYVCKRFWRIYPELWVAVAIELLVLLALYDSPIDWPLFGLFAICQSTILNFWTPDCLRGYGCGCPNGALWTICVLIQFYILAYWLYKVLHNSNVFRWTIAFVFALVLSIACSYTTEYIPENIGKLLNQTIVPYLWIFIVSSFVAEYKDEFLPWLKKYWLQIAMVLIVIRHFHLDIEASYRVCDTTMLFLCVVGMAYRLPFLNIKTDISYAIYIYHMTVVNVLLQLGYTKNSIHMAIVFATTCILAYISTETIGKWALKRKNRTNKTVSASTMYS